MEFTIMDIKRDHLNIIIDIKITETGEIRRFIYPLCDRWDSFDEDGEMLAVKDIIEKMNKEVNTEPLIINNIKNKILNKKYTVKKQIDKKEEEDNEN